MKRDKKFGDQVAEIKLIVIDEFEVQLRQVALGRLPLTSPQVTALIFALKGNLPEKYRDRYGVELTGKDGEAIQVHTIEVEKDYGPG